MIKSKKWSFSFLLQICFNYLNKFSFKKGTSAVNIFLSSNFVIREESQFSELPESYRIVKENTKQGNFVHSIRGCKRLTRFCLKIHDLSARTEACRNFTPTTALLPLPALPPLLALPPPPALLPPLALPPPRALLLPPGIFRLHRLHCHELYDFYDAWVDCVPY